MFPELVTDDVFRLETKRLWLRWPRAADAPAIARLAGEREVAEQTARIPHPYPPGAAAEFVLATRKANIEGKSLILVLALKARPTEPIGSIGMENAPDLELGYWLGRPFWGQGLMSEAAQALVDLTFRLSEVRTIYAAARAGNLRSVGVLGRCGFVPAGAGVQNAPARGGAVPVERYRLPRSVWAQRGSRVARAALPEPALALTR